MGRLNITDLFESDGINESIRVIGTISKLVRVSLKKNLSSVIAGLISQNVTDVFLRLSFSAASVLIRSIATKTLCLLLPYSIPGHVDVTMSTLVPSFSSFGDYLIQQAGNFLNPLSTQSTEGGKIHITNSAENNLHLEVLKVLVSVPEGSVWNMEFERELSLHFEKAQNTCNLIQECLEGKLQWVSDLGCTKLNHLIGYLSACQIDLGHHRFIPGRSLPHYQIVLSTS